MNKNYGKKWASEGTGTNNDTWDSEMVGSFLDLAEKRGKDRTFMKNLFFDLLEHDSWTAAQFAKQTEHFAPEIRRKLEKFAAAYLSLRKTLLKATKCSDKF